MKIKLRDEYNKFIEDMEKNFKKKEDLDYIKEKFALFVDKVIDEIDMILDYKQEKMNELNPWFMFQIVFSNMF